MTPSAKYCQIVENEIRNWLAQCGVQAEVRVTSARENFDIHCDITYANPADELRHHDPLLDHLHDRTFEIDHYGTAHLIMAGR